MNDEAAAEPGSLASPCVGVCRVDKARGECVSCRRTLEEIGAWRSMDDAARRAVLAAASERRARFGFVPAQTAVKAQDSGGGIE